MASDGPTVPLDSPEDQREGNHSLSCLTDTAAPETEFPADHNNDKAINTTTGSAEQEEEGGDICQFFLVGKCRFGHRCRLSHRSPSLDNTEATLPDQESRKDDEKVGKHKKKKGKVNKTTKPKDTEREETTKKPRMRTADEVISRVLWDPSVEASEFVVGYVDRFLGVLERPFSEFNWDADPCDCDYSTELALPHHRILYFTYRGLRVWDRHSRIDKVFGSTGHTLAPPFGGGEEVEGVRTQDAEQQDPLNPHPCGSTEDQRSAVSGPAEGELEEPTCSENRHLEEDGQNDTNVHTALESTTQPAPTYTGSTTRGQQEAEGESKSDVEMVLNRPQTSTDQLSQVKREGETGEEEGPVECWEQWKESSVGDKDELKFHIDPCPPVPLKQSEEKRGSWPPKRRPTHFITFKANTPSILSSFQRLQEELTSLLPSSAPHWIAPSTLHITLCLLVLPGPAEVAAAREILQRFAHLDRNPPVAVSFPVKLKHFNGKVLYLSPQPQLPIQHLNSGLQEAYRKEGWLHRDSFNTRYHLTLAKVEDREGQRVFERVGDLKVGKGMNFGHLPVNTLHLCAMGMSKTDGFYETLCTVTLR